MCFASRSGSTRSRPGSGPRSRRANGPIPTRFHAITKRIWTASAGGKHYDPDHIYSHGLIALLNYFDTLAISVEQNFYDEAVVRRHMFLIVAHAVKTFVLTDPPGKFVDQAGYEALIRLYRRWAPPPASEPAP